MERAPGESANDRNDRAIRTAVQWYERHLGGNEGLCQVRTVLLTNDIENRNKARSDGLLAYTGWCG